eukprot:CAMPEP_0185017952 /NCGR_PEP_ID=MMETSP1103-20130426/801_1 /TAXON_ID=36769 /ORGANISM="Paraphysomonas bandaiensis, Strain Caron Lab Isolate" /LENGTH=375 /DNA_ID=CAMNT_0027547575 /DNA_START=324 /DNA_END=1451 /DNA_ORIENTATION=+
MRWWRDVYSSHTIGGAGLEPARDVDSSMHSITPSSWSKHIVFSDFTDYPAFLQYFDDQLRTGSIDDVVQRHVPELIHGLAGSALHPIIHLGLGMESEHKGMVAEGLACMCCACLSLPLPSSPALWTEDSSSQGLIDSAVGFLSRAQEGSFHDRAKKASETPEYMAHNIGSFQRRLLAFTDSSYPMLGTLNDACPLRLPPVDQSMFPAVKEATALAAASFLASNCEFFVIHGLTSLHGLLVVMQYLPEDLQRDAIIHWWRAVAAVLVCQGIPNAEGLLDRLHRWQDAESAYTLTDTGTDSQAFPVPVNHEAWWQSALHEALKSTDEHVPKAVYALWRWSCWQNMPPHSLELFRDAAANIVRPTDGGGPEKHIWFAG